MKALDIKSFVIGILITVSIGLSIGFRGKPLLSNDGARLMGHFTIKEMHTDGSIGHDIGVASINVLHIIRIETSNHGAPQDDGAHGAATSIYLTATSDINPQNSSRDHLIVRGNIDEVETEIAETLAGRP